MVMVGSAHVYTMQKEGSIMWSYTRSKHEDVFLSSRTIALLMRPQHGTLFYAFIQPIIHPVSYIVNNSNMAVV
jgi:hypothetical protein